jgi:hypothetical protein
MKPEIRFIEVEYHEAPAIKLKIALPKKDAAIPEPVRRRFPLFSLNLFRTIA